MRSNKAMITANKIAITINDIVLVICQKEVGGELPLAVEVGVSVGVSGEVEDDGAGVGLSGTFAGMVIVCVGLQALVVP
jgi:hypothetical protein